MSIKTLKNGLRYFINKSKSHSSATIFFMANVGSINEKKGEYGLAHFLEHMLFKGTKRRLTSKNVTNNIYKIGAETNAFTSFGVTAYYINVSHDYVEDVLDILSDMLYNSTFVDLKKERDVVISENKKSSSSPQAKLALKINNMIYKGTPYGRCVGGNNSLIKKFTKKMTIDFYKRFYFPKNIVISISGRVPKNINNLVKKYFDKTKLKNKKIERVKIKDFMGMQQKMRFYSMVDKNMKQEQVILGFPSYKYQERKSYVLQLISIVLGGNMSSRLFVKLREEMGLVYTVSADVDTNIDCGDFTISFGTFLGKGKLATDVVIKELLKIRKEGITKKELEQSVNYICGMIDLSEDNNNSNALSNGLNILKIGKIIRTEQEKKIYRSIKLEEINTVAKEIIKYNKLNLCILSNKKHKNYVKEF